MISTENMRAKMSILQKLNYHTTKLQILIKNLHSKIIVPELTDMDIHELRKVDRKIDEACRIVECLTMENILEDVIDFEEDPEDE